MGAQGSGQQVQTPPDERLKDSTEIQGNILAPFNKPHQMFLFLNFRNSQRGARQWLATITDKHRIATTRAVTEHNAEYRDWKARDDDAPQPTSVWMAVGLTPPGAW